MADTIEDLTAAVEGQTLATCFLHTVAARPDAVALRERGPTATVGTSGPSPTTPSTSQAPPRRCASSASARATSSSS